MSQEIFTYLQWGKTTQRRWHFIQALRNGMLSTGEDGRQKILCSKESTNKSTGMQSMEIGEE